jgi:hypothetical protein
MQHARLVAGDDDVRLEGGEPAIDHLAAERGDVVVRRELRRSGHLPRARTSRSTVRPVDGHLHAQGAAEELVDGHAIRLPREIEECVLDGGDGFRHDPARALPCGAVEIPVDRLPRARIATHDERREVFDDAGEAPR